MRRYFFIFTILFIFASSFQVLAQEADEVIFAKIKAADSIQDASLAIKELYKILNTEKLTVANEVAAKVDLSFKLTFEMRYDEAFKICFESIEKARKQKQDSAECIYLKMLATNYYFLGKKEESLNTFIESLQIAEKKKYKYVLGNLSSNIGGILIEMSRFSEAENFLMNADKAMDDLKLPIKDRFITLRLIATVYQKTKRTAKADSMFQKLIDKSLLEKDSMDAAYLWTFYGTLLNENGETKRAIEMTEKAVTIIRNDEEKASLITTLNMLRGYYFKEKNWLLLQSIDSEIIDLQKKVFDVDLNKKISDAEVKYKTAEIAYQKELTDIKLKKNKELYVISFVGFLCVAGISFYFINQRNKAQQKTKLEKERTSSILNGEEKERSRVAQELHDGVGQLISAAKMNLNSYRDNATLNADQNHIYEKAVLLVEESYQEIRSIARNLSPNIIMQQGLSKALEHYLQQIKTETLNIQLHVDDNIDSVLYEQQQIILYRVLQECIQNILKHAQATQVDIAILNDDEWISVTIEDNGIGFDTQITKNGLGLGLQNIQNRIHFLNGTVEWDSHIGAGTMIAIHLPIQIQSKQ